MTRNGDGARRGRTTSSNGGKDGSDPGRRRRWRSEGDEGEAGGGDGVATAMKMGDRVAAAMKMGGARVPGCRFKEGSAVFKLTVSACRLNRFYGRATVEPVCPPGPNRFSKHCILLPSRLCWHGMHSQVTRAP
ncbi:hypothetical protein PIB30_038024 [Stylosanthes scabra]|uniref:Uncharacterized protein n=1 Tax=Stylosanthes scabra TaxID=79078 RepID=A0ABU6TEM1_9FABA|nr:hypothetical protein [Stylosanthes scabra]